MFLKQQLKKIQKKAEKINNYFFFYFEGDIMSSDNEFYGQKINLELEQRSLDEGQKVRQIIFAEKGSYKIMFANVFVDIALNNEVFAKKYFDTTDIQTGWNPLKIKFTHNGLFYVPSSGNKESVYEPFSLGFELIDDNNVKITGNYNQFSYDTGNLLIIAHGVGTSKNLMEQSIDDFVNQKNMRNSRFNSNDQIFKLSSREFLSFLFHDLYSFKDQPIITYPVVSGLYGGKFERSEKELYQFKDTL
jgi:hypothetical protein